MSRERPTKNHLSKIFMNLSVDIHLLDIACDCRIKPIAFHEKMITSFALTCR